MINDKCADQKEPYVECIAYIHGSIKKAWFLGKLELAMWAMLMHL